METTYKFNSIMECAYTYRRQAAFGVMKKFKESFGHNFPCPLWLSMGGCNKGRCRRAYDTGEWTLFPSEGEVSERPCVHEMEFGVEGRRGVVEVTHQLPTIENEEKGRRMWFCIRTVMVYACLTPEDTAQFFYKHNSDWWNFHSKVQSFLTPPCIPLPTMVDMVGGDRTRDKSEDSEDIPWKRRIPSWRESTRVWSEWFRLVAGCPSPTESKESWAAFRYDAEEWWQEFAASQSETQHRIHELAEWLRDRSDRRGEPNHHKELDERGEPRTTGNTTFEERNEWKQDREPNRYTRIKVKL
jgi:hypothetical protein